MQTKRNLVLLGCFLGLFETISQVVLIRELLIAFTGNELTIATVLALWLVSVSAGCLAAGRSRAPRAVHTSVAAMFIIAGVFSVLQVILIRLARPAVAPAGELLSPAMTVAVAAVGVAPCAAVLGALFVALVRYGREHSHPSPVPAVYGGEALGAGLAGALLTLWLLEAANPVAIAAAGSAVAAVAAITVLAAASRPVRRRGTAAAAVFLAALGLLTASSGRIDIHLRDLEWGPFEVIESVDSRFGNVVVTRRDGLHDFYESGAFAFTIVDPMYAEETVHIPLLYHPDPRRVLIVGASGSGVVSECLKHPVVERVDFVELDPSIIGLAEKYGPPDHMGGAHGAVRPLLGDGRTYIAGTAEKYDIIIVAAGLPLSLQVNRLYTVEFFESTRGALMPGGIIGLKVDASGAYMGPDLGGLINSMANALRRVFAHVELLPGGTVHILASDRALAGRRSSLIGTLADRGVETAYINEFFLLDRLSDLRAAELDSVLALYDSGSANTDGRPATFSYALAIWAGHFRSGKGVAWAVSNLGPGTTVLFLAAIASVIVLVYARASGLGTAALVPLGCLYSTGFTTMFTTVLLMLCFQISRGYVYTRLAVIIAAFMFALGLTATLAGRRLARLRERPGLIALQAALVCLPLIAAGVFMWVQRPSTALPGAAVDALYIVLAFVAGAMGASLFTAASASLMRKETGTGTVRAGALAYSIDLLGASVAGFSTGFLIIPALGIANAAMAVALVNFTVLGALLFAIPRSPGPRPR